MSDLLGPGPHTRVRRMPETARYDEATIYSILDQAPMCHVATILEGRAVCLPTLCVREDHQLYLHASRSSALLGAVVAAGEAFVTATIYDGLRLARSGFESSIAYRSVTVFGAAEDVTDADEKRRVLDLLVDAVLPGRASEVRPASEREISLTRVVRVTIDEAAAKVASGPTDDSAQDALLQIWSGVVPARLAFGPPIPSGDGAMASGMIDLPASVRRLLAP